MHMIKGKWEFDNGTQAKVYKDANDEIMVKLVVPSYTSILIPFDELCEFVDTVGCEFDDI